MAGLFTLAGEMSHRIGDHTCPACEEDDPEPCRCGGLMHVGATGERGCSNPSGRLTIRLTI
jgi:hypothetical protein